MDVELISQFSASGVFLFKYFPFYFSNENSMAMKLWIKHYNICMDHPKDNWNISGVSPYV